MSILKLAPAAIFVAAAGNNDNVTPAPDISTINRLYVDTSAGAATIRSIVAGADGQLLWIRVFGGNPLTLANLSGTSPASNQLSGIADMIVPSDANILIFYDEGDGLWIMGV